MRLLLNVLVSSLAVFVTARVLPGVAIDGFGTSVVFAVVLGAVNAVFHGATRL